jgi:hypothetical protein
VRTAITVAVLLLLAGCKTPMSNVGFTVTNVHGPGLKGGNYVTCANANTEFNVNVSEQTIRYQKVGDLCPSGERW